MRRVPQEHFPELIRKYNDGILVKVIASDYGCAPTTIRRIAKRHGLPPRKPTVYFHTATDKILEAYRAGEQCTRIAERFQLHPDSVRAIARRAGIAPRYTYKHANGPKD